jgi:hypothetical protein
MLYFTLLCHALTIYWLRLPGAAGVAVALPSGICHACMSGHAMNNDTEINFQVQYAIFNVICLHTVGSGPVLATK